MSWQCASCSGSSVWRGKVRCRAYTAAPGEVLDEAENDRLDALIEDVEQSRPPGSERPLENLLIFGNFQVAYVSTRKAPKQGGQREFKAQSYCSPVSCWWIMHPEVCVWTTHVCDL